MKIIILSLALLGVTVASPINEEQYPRILRQEVQINPDGTHSVQYETENGIYEDQQGYPKGPDNQAVQGQFQYPAPDGQIIRVTYLADENGFQPQGAHLPTPPPIPAIIQKALDFIAKQPAQRNNLQN